MTVTPDGVEVELVPLFGDVGFVVRVVRGEQVRTEQWNSLQTGAQITDEALNEIVARLVEHLG